MSVSYKHRHYYVGEPRYEEQEYLGDCIRIALTGSNSMTPEQRPFRSGP